jgi:hypothetical protein
MLAHPITATTKAFRAPHISRLIVPPIPLSFWDEIFDFGTKSLLPGLELKPSITGGAS